MPFRKDNFSGQGIDRPVRWDLLVTNTSELIRDVKIGGSLGYSDHAVVESAVLRDRGQAKGKVQSLNFRKTNLQLL